MLADIERARRFRERFAPRESGAGAGEFALAVVGESGVKFASGDPSEEGVAELFEAVVTDERGVGLLVEVGAVDERLAEQTLVVESRAERALEGGEALRAGVSQRRPSATGAGGA